MSDKPYGIISYGEFKIKDKFEKLIKIKNYKNSLIGGEWDDYSINWKINPEAVNCLKTHPWGHEHPPGNYLSEEHPWGSLEEVSLRGAFLRPGVEEEDEHITDNITDSVVMNFEEFKKHFSEIVAIRLIPVNRCIYRRNIPMYDYTIGHIFTEPSITLGGIIPVNILDSNNIKYESNNILIKYCENNPQIVIFTKKKNIYLWAILEQTDERQYNKIYDNIYLCIYNIYINNNKNNNYLCNFDNKYILKSSKITKHRRITLGPVKIDRDSKYSVIPSYLPVNNETVNQNNKTVNQKTDVFMKIFLLVEDDDTQQLKMYNNDPLGEERPQGGERPQGVESPQGGEENEYFEMYLVERSKGINKLIKNE
eukprot:GHVL01038783.1.p1 GENE.GHVL01038783.1~~GHVL01038783.1.p1  ORF type:complete len:404 (+),score=170.69 GHVL01038783.1:116-1213(+)